MSSEALKLATSPVRDRVTAQEWDTRVDLAACYRLAAHYRMTDLIYTHISARVPGPDHHFLINAFGLAWDEIGASTLVHVGLINGLPGFVTREADGEFQTTALDIQDGHITGIYVMRNPDKLRHLH